MERSSQRVVSSVRNTARMQAASYGPGVEVAVQLNGKRWTFVQDGTDPRYINETITTGWDERFIIPAGEAVLERRSPQVRPFADRISGLVNRLLLASSPPDRQ